MEIVLQILSVAVVLLAFIGALAMIGMVATIIMIVHGGEIHIGYEEDNDKIINNQNEEEK